MKKIYVTVILLTLFIRYASAQTQFQYFDGADTMYYNSVNISIDTAATNIWQIGPPQKIIFDSASTQPNVIVTDTINNYPVNNTSRFTANILNQFWPNGVYAIQWKQKLDLDTNGDGGMLEFTIDHGLTWQNAFNNPYVYNFYGFQPSNVDTLNNGQLAFSGTDSTWRDIWLCFDLSWMSQFPDTITFRFSLISDSVNTAREGWMIDNMISHITIIHTVGTIQHENYLNVFPNPTSDIVHVETQKIAGFHIIEHMELVDVQGKVVAQWNNIPTKFWFDAGKYGAGTYVLNIKTNLKSESFPIIVTKQK
ncbi:MAG: T9SS type A sorting domain-containing protein [Bacteroidota bacterium]|nr:T9SS type A sorting domain-containing protein [Bacteroidota bacterium]